MDNYFTIFGLPQSFDININDLVECYRNLQRTVHPDKFVNASERDKRIAMQKSVQINEAFQTLKKPLNRGLYLLQLNGIDTDSNSEMDSEFLMMQMELHEQLNYIKQHSNPTNHLNEFLTKIQQEQQQLNELVSMNFSQNDLQLAYANVRKMQFFTKLHQEALRLEEELIEY